MKQFLTILSILVCFNSFATTHVVGTGSGTVSVTSMSGLTQGDTLLIKTGVYSNGTFTNLTRIVILPQGTRSVFTGTVVFTANNYCEFAYVNFLPQTGVGLDMRSGGGKNINHCYLHNISFVSVTGEACIIAHNNYYYTRGDSTTFTWNGVTLDSIYEEACNKLITGSFGQPSNNGGSPPDVFNNTTISRFVSVATISSSQDGMEIIGISLKSNFHDWAVLRTTQRLATGDVGLFYGHGNGNFYNIYRNGGPGYAIRIFPSMEVGQNDGINIYNCAKLNGSEYGLTSVQWDISGDSVAGVWSNVRFVNIYNNTCGNAVTNITYWCQVAVLGTRGPGPRYQVRNNLGFNIQTTGKPDKIVMNQGETWPTESSDTSNNKYWNTATEAQVDSITAAFSNYLGSFGRYSATVSSPGIYRQGTTALTNTDFYGVSYNTPPTIGYAQVYIPTGCNCIIEKKGRRKKFINK